ncbi:MAG: hypothetical protein AAFX99_17805 [Myxococcota bacterium]
MLTSCSTCHGFIPHEAPACPHCAPETVRTEPPRRMGTLKKLGTVLMSMAGGGLLMTTLMACYGAPPPKPNRVCEPTQTDKDGDCMPAPDDCNDSDPTVQTGCTETP